MGASTLSWLQDGLILLGLLILSLAIYGIIRMPDLYTRLHAASKAAVLGVLPFLLAAALLGDPAIISRVLLIGAFLILTTPVAAHAIAHAAYLKGERMETPGAVDEARRNPPTAE